MAQWIRRLPTEQEIPGSSPGRDFFFLFLSLRTEVKEEIKKKKKWRSRVSTPVPRAC